MNSPTIYLEFNLSGVIFITSGKLYSLLDIAIGIIFLAPSVLFFWFTDNSASPIFVVKTIIKLSKSISVIII